MTLMLLDAIEPNNPCKYKHTSQHNNEDAPPREHESTLSTYAVARVALTIIRAVATVCVFAYSSSLSTVGHTCMGGCVAYT